MAKDHAVRQRMSGVARLTPVKWRAQRETAKNGSVVQVPDSGED